MQSSEDPTTQAQRPELSASINDRRTLIYAGLAALVVVALFIGFVAVMFIYPGVAAVLRDIAIIFLGVMVVFVILLLVAIAVGLFYVVMKLNDLIALLNREIKPLLAQSQATVKKAYGTTSFVSGYTVKPVIETYATIAGVRAVIRTLFRRE